MLSNKREESINEANQILDAAAHDVVFVNTAICSYVQTQSEILFRESCLLPRAMTRQCLESAGQATARKIKLRPNAKKGSRSHIQLWRFAWSRRIPTLLLIFCIVYPAW